MTVSNEIGLDWLQGSIPFARVEELCQYVTALCGREPDALTYGQFRYDRQFYWASINCRLYFDSSFDRSKDVHNLRACFQLSGSGCSALGLESLWVLVHDLVERFAFLGTRIDTFFDDFSKRISPETVYVEHCRHVSEKGVDYTRFKRCAFIHSVTSKGEDKGSTLSFGVRGQNGGGSYVRFYDKEKESKGERLCFRWEIETTKHKAQELAWILSQAVDASAFMVLCGAVVAGSIDFVRRGSGSRADRGTRLDWWESILSELGDCVSFASVKREKSVEKSGEWFKASVVPTVAMFKAAYGENFTNWFKSLCDSKNELNSVQKACVDDFRFRAGLPSVDWGLPF